MSDRAKRTRLVAGVLTALVVLAGCGSGSTSKAEVTSTTTEKLAPLRRPSLDAQGLELAVFDNTHALVIEDDRAGIAAAGITDGSGRLEPLPEGLPPLFNPRAAGTSDGYLIVGLRCADGEPINTTIDEEQICTRDIDNGTAKDAEPLAIELTPDGNIISTFTGPPVSPGLFGDIAVSDTKALIDFGAKDYAISNGSFTLLEPPPQDYDAFNFCLLRDGQLVAFAADFVPPIGTAGGTHSSLTYRDGKWVSVGNDVAFDKHALISTSCVSGELISRTQVFSNAKGPIAANLQAISSQSVVGITVDGLILVDKNPALLIDPVTGATVASMPDAHAVAISWDGKTIAQVTKDGIRLESRP